MRKLISLFLFFWSTWSPIVSAFEVPSNPNQPNDPCANWNAIQDPEFFTNSLIFDIHTAGMKSQIDSFMRLRSGDNMFSSHVKGCAGEKEVWISPSNDYNYYSKSEKGSAIALRFYPTLRKAGIGTDKMMWNIRDKRNGGNVKIGDTVYTAFAFKVPKNFSAPLHNKNFMIFQVWQGSPFHPPISIHVNGTGVGNPKKQALSLKLLQVTMDGDKDSAQILLSTPLQRGQWIELIVGVRFDTRNGSVNVYKREGDHFEPLFEKSGLQTAFEREQAFKIRDDQIYYPNKAAAVLLGLYRMRQPTKHVVLFDEIRVGDTFESVLLPKSTP